MKSLGRVVPLYVVVFIGFVGYSLMITVFTPLPLGDGGGLVSARSSTSTRTLVLGGLLALCPLAQFFGAPVLGSLSDRFGRRPVLLGSLGASAAFYALMGLALHLHSLALLAVACLLAGLSEANIRSTDLRRQLRPLPGDLRLLPRLPDVLGGPLRDGRRARVRVHRLGSGADRARQPVPGRPAVAEDGPAAADRAVRGGAGGVPGGGDGPSPRRRALGHPLRLRALALAICLPSMAAMVSDAVGPTEQGRALGTNQSLQTGAEGVSGLAGGGLAAISTALPLPAMGALALLGSTLLARPAAREAAEPAPETG